MTEKQLQAAIVKTARLFGWRVYHTHDSRRSEPGFPDLTLVRGGRLIFAELKTEKGKVSDAQAAWLDSLRLVPYVHEFVWRPADWLDGTVESVLRDTETRAA